MIKGLKLPEHGLALDIAKPNPEVGGEALAGQLQHGHVSTYTAR